MKKVLLTLAALSAVSIANAQQTYNYFDPADCDADGWLWFDTQAKLEKYCGFTEEFKIQLQSTFYDDGNGNYPEPELDGTIKGFDADGNEGGEGSKTGAIVLPRAYRLGETNGGGIAMMLPDLAEFSVFLSSNASKFIPMLQGAKNWEQRQDWAVFKGYTVFNPATKLCQLYWRNLQDFQNANLEESLKSSLGQKVTAAVTNGTNTPMLLQGIKVFTYTNTNSGSGIGEIGVDDANAPVEFFNMQGVRVSGDEPGLYIRRQGSKTSKVIVK